MYPAFPPAFKVNGTAFKNMRLVGADNIDIPGFESLHTAAGNQRPLSFYDPRDLHFTVAVKMVVEIRQPILLHDDGVFFSYRYGKLDDFHME
jgi:hypothetical protein